ncbi:MAG: hypothetical protein WBQ95_13610 [Terracidiphilus sp.]
MRKSVFVLAACAAMLLGIASVQAQNHANKNTSGQLVIVFKDGHRQTFNFADVARIEFSGTGSVPLSDAVSTPAGAPPRGHFLGKWEVGDGAGSTFYITLDDDGTAWRSLRRIHGKWVYVNGEARVTWDDGAMDAIRRIDGKDQKFAYRAGKSFTDEPDNVTNARNTSPRPI